MYFTTKHDLLAEELKLFRSCFSKPQWDHFQTYLLVVSMPRRRAGSTVENARHRAIGNTVQMERSEADRRAISAR